MKNKLKWSLVCTVITVLVIVGFAALVCWGLDHYFTATSVILALLVVAVIFYEYWDSFSEECDEEPEWAEPKQKTIPPMPKIDHEAPKTRMCDDFCRFTHECKIHNIEPICDKCPLNELEEVKR